MSVNKQFVAFWTDMYNSTLTRTTLSEGVKPDSPHTVCGGLGWGLFGSAVRVYNTNFTYRNLGSLSDGRTLSKPQKVKDFVVFAGGIVNDTNSAVVDVYDTSYTRATASQALSIATTEANTVNIADSGYALVPTGNYSSSLSTTSDIYYIE